MVGLLTCVLCVGIAVASGKSSRLTHCVHHRHIAHLGVLIYGLLIEHVLVEIVGELVPAYDLLIQIIQLIVVSTCILRQFALRLFQRSHGIGVCGVGRRIVRILAIVGCRSGDLFRFCAGSRGGAGGWIAYRCRFLFEIVLLLLCSAFRRVILRFFVNILQRFLCYLHLYHSYSVYPYFLRTAITSSVKTFFIWPGGKRKIAETIISRSAARSVRSEIDLL